MTAVAARRPRLELWAALIVLATAMLVAVLRLTGLPEFHRLRLGAAQWAFDDFKLILYYPARAFLDGANPYDAHRYMAAYPVEVPMAPYAPVSLLLGVPFALLPFGAAAIIHFGLTVAMTAALAIAALRLSRAPVRPTTVIAVTGLVLLSRPGHWNLLLGQITLPLVLGTYAAFSYRRIGSAAAAMGLAVALIKPTFGVPLALLLLARRDPRARRIALAGLALAAIVNLPVVAILTGRAGGVSQLITQVRGGNEMLFRNGNNAVTNVGRIDLAALFTRPLGIALGQAGEALIGLALLGAAAVLLRRLERAGESADAPRSLGVACLAILLGTYHQGYDLLLLLAPLVALARGLIADDGDGPYVRPVLLGLFGVLAVNFATSESGVAALRPGRAAWVLLTSVNGLALFAIFLLFAAGALRHARARAIPA